MSLLTELGAQVRATSDDLPAGLVAVAVDKLRAASDLLAWVRETSVDPLGVPQLGNAVEHAERAAHALRVAQDVLAGYLAAIGLAGEPPGPVEPDRTRPSPKADRASPVARCQNRASVPSSQPWSRKRRFSWLIRCDRVSSE